MIGKRSGARANPAHLIAMLASIGGMEAPAALATQPAPAALQAQQKQDHRTEAVTCFAGCSGPSGAVLARPNLPPPEPRVEITAGSGWRLVANNMWCHAAHGCRSKGTLPTRTVVCRATRRGNTSLVACSRN